MATLPELVALSDTIDIGGEKYVIGVLTARDYAEIERRILSNRADPIAVARALSDGLPPDERREILMRAYDDGTKARRVTARELDEWMQSLGGVQFTFWLCVRKSRPSMTLDQAGELLDQLGQQSVLELMNHASGLPEANPTTPTQVDQTPETLPFPGDSGTDA
jgi:hypothetical protein